MSLPLHYTQNFLWNRELVRRVVAMAAIPAGATVLEIGPGKGIITEALAEHVGPQGRVVGIELDAQLAQELTEKFASWPQVEILHQDFLQFKLDTLGEGYSVFSNIPFAVSALILERLFAPDSGPQQACLILQNEALPYSESTKAVLPSLKSLLILPWYEISVAHTFERSDYKPQPRVDTSLFAFQRRPTPLLPVADFSLYQDFLAFIAQDRVGEGAWKKLMLSRELQLALRETKLEKGRGLRQQRLESLLEFFQQRVSKDEVRTRQIRGALAQLRRLQMQTLNKNERESHRPTRRQ